MSKKIIAEEPNVMGLSRKRTNSGMTELSCLYREANGKELVRTLCVNSGI